MKKLPLILSMLILLVCGMALSAYGAQSTDMQFFKGKNMQFLIPASPGGGRDHYARIISTHMSRELGATIIPNNTPGAGGIVAINQMVRAPQDGLTMSSLNMPGALFSQIMGEPGMQFDVNALAYIGRMEIEPDVIYVYPGLAVKTLQELINKVGEFTMGFSGLGSDDYYCAQISLNLMGVKMRPIAGFSGAPDTILSVVKGDVNVSQHSYSTIANLIDNGEIMPLYVFGSERLPELPDIPTVLELCPPEELPKLKRIIEMRELGRATVAVPGGVPQERVTALREAFWRAMHSPELIEECEKSGRPINAMRGEEVQEMVRAIYNSQDVWALVEDLKILIEN